MDQIDKLKKRIADVAQARAKEKNKQERNNKTTERKRNTIPHILEWNKHRWVNMELKSIKQLINAIMLNIFFKYISNLRIIQF